MPLPLFLLLGIYNVRPGETFHRHPKITKFLLYCAYQGNEDPCLKLFVLLSQLQYWLGCVCSVQRTWYMKPQDSWSKNIGFSPSRLGIYKKVKSDRNISHNDQGNVTAPWEENIAWIPILQYWKIQAKKGWHNKIWKKPTRTTAYSGISLAMGFL